MNATAKEGVWKEDLSDDVSINFDTKSKPERITIQKRGQNPVHLDYEEGIGEKEILRARTVARETFNLK